MWCIQHAARRAELLFKAGVHPSVRGTGLARSQFDAVWAHAVTIPVVAVVVVAVVVVVVVVVVVGVVVVLSLSLSLSLSL